MDIEEVLKKSGILNKKNVVGFSGKLMPKIKDGVVTDEKVIRIYVTKKLPPNEIPIEDVIPKSIVAMGETIKTDVVAIGDLKALVDKTSKFRPEIPLGVSIGHYSITAGSLGMYYTDIDGEIYMGSNAHVFTPNASMGVGDILDKRIIQCGRYHGGTADDVVAEYVWHKQIIPFGVSKCPVGNFIAKSMNLLPKVFGRKGRFEYCNIEDNLIDFAIAKPIKGIVPSLNTADDCIPNGSKFIGHLFAGSEFSGIICKLKHILKEGYFPMYEYTTDVKEGDSVKGCSFWCHYQTNVIDTSAVVTVNYGDFSALFKDVIIVENNGTIRGGYSGSGWFKVS